ncbi:hypothetical protein ALNOE001_01780 [Candidatus Methanobinarius endosymbioticus]|uniref:Uncharacterized protein n=1 Tax=Candidatus Methanobinarius endosymbioticus TaxID=2006182 RepID=A0A366ME23_9EURY|nr:hypothetical protein ALNOE001_01780 [Candidatus Methanobinarius endosymbioticus]
MEKKKFLIIFAIMLLTISSVGTMSAANETTNTKKQSSILVWDYYPATSKYAVFHDYNNDGKFDDII